MVHDITVESMTVKIKMNGDEYEITTDHFVPDNALQADPWHWLGEDAKGLVGALLIAAGELPKSSDENGNTIDNPAFVKKYGKQAVEEYFAAFRKK